MASPVALLLPAAGLLCLLGGLVAVKAPLIVLALPFALVAAGWFYRHSEVGMFMLQDALPLVMVPLSWVVPLPELPLSLPFIALWALATAGRVFLGGQKLPNGWIVRLFLLFSLYALVSYLVIAERTPYAGNKLYLLLTINLFSFLAGATFVRRQFPAVMRAMSAAGLAVALFTLSAFAQGNATMPGRYSHLGQNPITGGRLTLTGAFSTFALTRRALWRLGYLALAVPASVLTGSRGPLVGALAAAGFLGLARLREEPDGGRGRLLRRAAAFAGAGLLALGLAGAPAAVAQVRDLGESGTAMARAELYRAAFAGFASDPLFGIGIGGFATLVNEREFEEVLPYPHNMALEIACELGLVGLGLMAATVVLCLACAWRLARRGARGSGPEAVWGTAIAGAFVHMLMSCQFSGDLVTNHSLFFYMGLLVGAEALSPLPEAEKADVA